MKPLDLINKNIHFIGIAGSGMIALAQYLRGWGRCRITGSEIRETNAAQDLLQQGIKITFFHHQDNLKNADIVVYSRAISDTNCELSYAKKKNIPCFSRGEFLAELMKTYSRQIAISGSHGKTTTTGMLIHILDASGITPSFMVGGERPPYHINGRYSESSTFIAESDESDGSFLLLNPTHSILNNLEPEHLDYYKSFEKLIESFKTFCQQSIQRKSLIAYNNDDSNLVALVNSIDSPYFTSFSIDNLESDFTARNLVFNTESSTFDLYHKGNFQGKISLNLIGTHNIYNALAACSICLNLGISITHIQQGLANFKGVKRRIQHIFSYKNIQIYDDYGHHPTEIQATLNGLKQSKKAPIICIFQPHRYSRVKEHMTDFHGSFNHADHVLITPIYSANEVNNDDTLLDTMIQGIKQHSTCNVHFFNSFDEIINHLVTTLKQGDVVVTMGAGDIYKVSNKLAYHYQNL